MLCSLIIIVVWLSSTRKGHIGWLIYVVSIILCLTHEFGCVGKEPSHSLNDFALMTTTEHMDDYILYLLAYGHVHQAQKLEQSLKKTVFNLKKLKRAV